MLKDRDEVAVLSAVLSCFMWRSLTRIQNSTLPWYFIWEELTKFSRGRVCKPGELTTGNSEWPVHPATYFPGNQILTIASSIKIRLELWQIILHPIQCSVDSKDSPPSCSFSPLKELGPIHTGEKCQMEQEISNFPEKKDSLERWTEIFETNFRRKISVPFDFEPEFPEILVEWNAPLSRNYLFFGGERRGYTYHWPPYWMGYTYH